MNRHIILLMLISFAISGCGINLPPALDSEGVQQVTESVAAEKDVLYVGVGSWMPNQYGWDKWNGMLLGPKEFHSVPGLFMVTDEEVLFYIKAKGSGELRFAKRIPLSTIQSVEVHGDMLRALVITSDTGLDSFSVGDGKSTLVHPAIERAAEVIRAQTGLEKQVN